MSYRHTIVDARRLIVAPALFLLVISGCSNPCKENIRFMELDNGKYVQGCPAEDKGDFIRFHVLQANWSGNEVWRKTSWQRRTEKVKPE